MAELGQLLESAPAQTLVQLAGRTAPGREATRVSSVDRLEELASTQPGSIVIVPGHCVEAAANYEFDVAVRVAADRGLAALVFQGQPRIPTTVKRLADLGGLALLGTPSQVSLVELVRTLDHLMGSTYAASLERAATACNWLAEQGPASSPGTLVSGTQRLLGTALELTWLPSSSASAVNVVVAGVPVGSVTGSDLADPAVVLTLPSLAAAISRGLEHHLLETEEVGDSVAALLRAEGPELRLAVARAAGARVDLSKVHSVVCASLDSVAAPMVSGPQVALRRARALAAVLLEHDLGLSEGWIVTEFDTHLALVISRDSSQADAQPDVIATAQELLALIAKTLATQPLFAGAGSPAMGLEGLRTSAIEARSAVSSARIHGTPGTIAPHTTSTVERLLADLQSSAVSRRVLESVLAPLESLPEKTQWTTVETLSTYLDHQGSKVRSAADLHLHPNAVGYRVRKAAEQLNVDLGDPDVRFMLQLACRVWLISHGAEQRMS